MSGKGTSLRTFGRKASFILNEVNGKYNGEVMLEQVHEDLEPTIKTIRNFFSVG